MKIKKQFFSGVVRVFWLSLAGVLILSLGMVNPVRADGVPDLTVASTHSEDFDQGGVGSYTLTVTNLGTATGSTDGVTAITVTDTLPAGLTATGMGGDGWTCPVPVDGVVPPPLTCTRTDVSTVLTIGNSYPDIILDVAVDPDAAVDAPYILVNEVTVDGGGEVNITNNSDTDDTTITQKPNLEMQMVDSGDFVQGGVDKTFTITITNVGHAPTDGTAIVVENFTVDADLTVKSISGTNWTCVGLICTRDAAGDLDILSVGDSFEDIILTVDVHVDADTSVMNEADLSGTLRGGDMDTSNNSASRAPSVTQKPDLTVEKIHSGNFTQGGVGTYTITVKNSNAYAPTAGDASITVTDTLPAGLTATDMIGNNWTCPDPVNGIIPAPLTCTHPAVVLAAGANLSDTITVTVKVAANAAASVTNTVTVSGGGQVNLSNDSFEDSTTILPMTDLDITNVTLLPDSPIPGQDFVATVTVQNWGRKDSESIVPVYAFIDPADGLWPLPPLTCDIEGDPSWDDRRDDYTFSMSNSDTIIGAELSVPKTINIDGLSAGVHKIYFSVNPNCTSTESNETNNAYGPVSININHPFAISGNVGMAGVSLRYVIGGVTETAISDVNGNYILYVPLNWNGTVTPVMAGYVFLPLTKNYSNVTTNLTAQNYIRKVPPADFNGDGRTDVAIWRPGTGMWYVNGQFSQQWGAGSAGDVPIPGDYNGDGITDVAVWRPSSGMWYVYNQFSQQWGAGNAGDVPVPGDYNGDGTTDVAVWRPSSGMWYVNGQFSQQWGAPGDIPIPGDYNGDGITDVAVWRPSSGMWYVYNQFSQQWGAGNAGDVPVPGDYNGDGTTDVAVWRPSSGMWYVNGQFSQQWGAPGDIPIPGDYNGDGVMDVAVWRTGTGMWYVNGQFSQQWGALGDYPLPVPDTNGDGDLYQ